MISVLRRALFALPLLVPLALPAAAPAETLGDARIGFSAERILVIDGHRYVGRMWQMPGEQRHEQELQGLRPFFILHASRALGDLVLPQLHTVVEFALPRVLSILESPRLLRRPIGQQRIEGIAATEYAIDEASSEGRAQGAIWLSRDGIPMRCDATLISNRGNVARLHWELRHIALGPQPAQLFEIPKGYSRLPPEAVGPLLGLHLSKKVKR
jgi:hypothetical protein